MLFLLLTVLLLAGPVAWWKWSLRHGHLALPSTLMLPDGSVIKVVQVTYGTNHVGGSRLAQWVARSAPGLQGALTRLLGPKAAVTGKLSTPEPTLVVWLERVATAKQTMANSSSYPLGFTEVYACDACGLASGSPANFYFISGLMPLQFAAFPRRDSQIGLQFFYRDIHGVAHPAGTLKVENPVFRVYPQWQPETLPAVRHAGDVEVTLSHFSTGHGTSMNTSYRRSDGKSYEEISFGTNRPGEMVASGLAIPCRSLKDTNQVWRATGFELQDATGNLLKSSGMSWKGDGSEGLFGFTPSLWTNEAAWKLRCEIKRIKGFESHELLVFTNVPVGEMNQTNTLNWTATLANVTVTLADLVRRPPLTNNSWSSAQLSEARFLITGVTNDQQVDLMAVQSDYGTNLNVVGSSTGGNDQDYEFRDIASETKTLNFTFAVQSGRWVEFLVQPRIDTNGIVLPVEEEKGK